MAHCRGEVAVDALGKDRRVEAFVHEDTRRRRFAGRRGASGSPSKFEKSSEVDLK